MGSRKSTLKRRRIDRAVEGSRLLTDRAETLREFKSHILRQIAG